MRVLSIRALFECDHSSSTYHFSTVRRLTDSEKSAIKRLARETPQGHTLEKTYGGEAEMDWDTEKALLTRFYEVEVSESYDWWTARMSCDYGEELWAQLVPCAGRGSEDLGIDVERENGKILVSVYFTMEYDAAYRAFGEEIFPGLADLFTDLREELISGNLGALRVVAEFYHTEADMDWSTVLEQSKKAQRLRRILGRI